MKLIQGHYHNKNLPTLKFPRDKVFTLWMITMQTNSGIEFEVGPFIDQAKY
jgi:hypothetical protein